MGLSGPTREQRLDGAAAALAPYGFTFDPTRAQHLRQYLPLRECSTPERYVTACFGRIEDAHVEAYEYQHSSTDSEGHTSWYTSVLVAVQHPALPGGASFRPDPRAWSGVAAALDALLWVPPFILVKAVQLLAESRDPDRAVGDAEFDRLYTVHAESDAAARRALTPALRRAVLDLAFQGAVEMRPGLLLYAPHQYRFDAETAVSAVGIATVLLGALRSERVAAHPMR